MEERRKLRPRATEATSSLSVPRPRTGSVSRWRSLPSGGGAHGFEGEYPGRVRQRVSRATVCPLGQPNKAIGHESQIEPWLAHRHHSACRRSGTARRTQRLMDRDPAQCQGSRTQPHTGLDVRKITPSCGKGELFSLDIPFYRTRRCGIPPPKTSFEPWNQTAHPLGSGYNRWCSSAGYGSLRHVSILRGA